MNAHRLIAWAVLLILTGLWLLNLLHSIDGLIRPQVPDYHGAVVQSYRH